MSSYTDTLPKEQIGTFCRRWKIRELALFGSVIRDDFGASSDIDVLVTFADDASWSLLDHVQMEGELETIFGRDVDLITKRGVQDSRNWLRQREILDTAVTVYPFYS